MIAINMEKNITKGRVYLRKDIRLATFLGGPFVGAYLMTANFKALGTPEKAKKAWLMSALVFVVMLILLFAITIIQGGKKSSPPIFIPILYATLISLIIRDYQGEDIELYLDRGGKAHGLLRVIVIALLGAVLTFILPGYFVFIAAL